MNGSDKIIESTFNKLALASCDEFVEATCVYMEGKEPEVLENIVKTICYQAVWHYVRMPVVEEAYVHYMDRIMHTTFVVDSNYLPLFYEKMIEQSNVMFQKKYKQLEGHPPDFEFPDDNLLPIETARIIQFLLRFTSFPPIADCGFNMLKNIVSHPEHDANLILLPYILKIPQKGFGIPKPVLQQMYDKVVSLPESSFRSKLRFKLMDLLE